MPNLIKQNKHINTKHIEAVHEGNKSFECQPCDFKFNHNSSLQKIYNLFWHLTNSNWHYKVKFVFDKYTIMTRRQSSLEEHLIMKILCYAPLIFHIKELKNIRPNIRKILGHLYLYQILKIIGVYLYSEYLVILWLICTLQIFWLQKLQLLVVLRVRLQFGCDFCNYKLQLLSVANIATKSWSYQWLPFLQPIIAVASGRSFCNQ